MCEHAGMLNHLYAKIDDLEIGEGRWSPRPRPSASTSRCGSWCPALLVGGRTLLVEQEVILDVERFVDTIVDGRVNVLQVVPSYLEVVLSYLEQHPRELPDLRCVSVTGEALKKELAQRWFAVRPGIKLVNAYGLTETSDDTNHEVMDRAPDGDRVPLGPPVHNVHVYVVDEHLRPVPLGAPGPDRLLRGLRRPRVRQRPRAHPAVYLSRSRTGRGAAVPGRRLRPLAARRQAGVPRPPGHPGQDLRLPDRDRRDRERAAAGARRARRRGGGRRAGRPRQAPGGLLLRASRPIEVEVLRDRLGRSLPEYMVPVGVPLAGKLPLTANSKIDTKALTALAGELSVVADGTTRRRHADRAAAGGRVAEGARRPAGPDRPARPLLRPRRHVAVGGEAGDRAGAGGVPQGRHPAPGARRPGRADRRPVRAGRRRPSSRVRGCCSCSRSPTVHRPAPWCASRTPAATR